MWIATRPAALVAQGSASSGAMTFLPRRLLAGTLLVAAAAMAQTPPPLIERIEVERVIIDARVTNTAGEPILGLQRGDFRVRLDGTPAQIESVDWISESHDVEQFENAAHVPNGSLTEPQKRGRLFVIFVQTDFGRAAPRLQGQMAVNAALDKWLAFLEPEDQTAVFSFDSHLKFRLDFSGDTAAVERAVKESLLIGEPPPPAPSKMWALSMLLDRQAMHDAARPEIALRIVGEALAKVPGAKSMIFICWGLGHVSNDVAFNDYGYENALLALQRARVTVFSIDMVGGHDLAYGLANIAGDTGGFYATSTRFPAIAIHRLHHTLGGHYEIEVIKPQLKQRGFHQIAVDVPTQRHVTILARNVFGD
ncbi:MAG TPA: VWA domain-containing protein [Thermoanaerobaculia bacterium]